MSDQPVPAESTERVPRKRPDQTGGPGSSQPAEPRPHDPTDAAAPIPPAEDGTERAPNPAEPPGPTELAPPRGTGDILPPESWRRQAATRLAMDSFAIAGYAPIETPIFEHTEVFERGVGAGSEVVGKEMYTFPDRGGRSLTLRPELTAPVMRAVLGHNLHRARLPVKLAYAGPMFRQERPQKGRYRQFSQVGIEAIGSMSPAIDAEVIEVGDRYLREAGVEPTLLLNSIGHLDPGCRTGYLEHLTEYLVANQSSLAPVDIERISLNPLRTFDSKESRTIEVMRRAPLITDHLCDDCRSHFEAVQSHLMKLEVSYTLDPHLVRGLDYYTRTAFEFTAGGLGSQNAVGGGGRYDGLAESLGGQHLPGIGFALGLDRILLSGFGSKDQSGPVAAYVVAIGTAAVEQALAIATRLRAAGIGADLDFLDRSVKGQMKDAARSGCRWAVIVGDEEIARNNVTLKDLSTGEQETVAFAELVSRLEP
ncbi:MAG: histidine--tRNA ligase [Actinobacteria bacterium]|nr:histidine--tRNA ligase [Actinomycetota bacterium]